MMGFPVATAFFSPLALEQDSAISRSWADHAEGDDAIAVFAQLITEKTNSAKALAALIFGIGTFKVF